MSKQSAGILLYRFADAAALSAADAPALEVWLVHMGGPFWARKDDGAWTIPKGEYDKGEDILAVARREFEEEVGLPVPDVPLVGLGSFRQSSGKIVTVFAAESDFRPDSIHSNTFSLEWPRGSGRLREFPEVDDARWFPVEEARAKVVRGQGAILDALERSIRAGGRTDRL
ncbi:NUDIX domain-containing protein [Cryobacterium tagatosivorans]|uniref:NUDIX domain-containing protein n=1 Tax=Cryobacterium tagatosivorans TaxID=1259199 RepID=A0A4R8UD89_9MICO|nr:NUDIX domain-containing protein [Cryobacterium tagatosivorans]TFB46963.1 NUDIX domain-containing protein [Cryobacterium tagatosivorans]